MWSSQSKVKSFQYYSTSPLPNCSLYTCLHQWKFFSIFSRKCPSKKFPSQRVLRPGQSVRDKQSIYSDIKAPCIAANAFTTPWVAASPSSVPAASSLICPLLQHRNVAIKLSHNSSGIYDLWNNTKRSFVRTSSRQLDWRDSATSWDSGVAWKERDYRDDKSSWKEFNGRSRYWLLSNAPLVFWEWFREWMHCEQMHFYNCEYCHPMCELFHWFPMGNDSFIKDWRLNVRWY